MINTARAEVERAECAEKDAALRAYWAVYHTGVAHHLTCECKDCKTIRALEKP